MFITRNRLEEIKSHERWKQEMRLNREREMSDMWERIHKLEHKVAMLEKATKQSTAETYSEDENVPIEYALNPPF